MSTPYETYMPERGWRRSLYIIIYGADTPLGRSFDIILILSIIASVGTVMLDSVASLREAYGEELYIAEWFFTSIFTVEYILRLSCTTAPRRYALSFFGIVDLLAILPTYLSIFFPSTQYLLVIRILRVLRVFRILKFVKFVGEADQLMRALYRSRRKITVFLFAVLSLVIILGSLMYLVEGPDSDFTSIPMGIYWAIVTLTTVGYGDISPDTNLGRALAAAVMILGYAIIAVPTGIVSAELTQSYFQERAERCNGCGHVNLEGGAKFCCRCGGKL